MNLPNRLRCYTAILVFIVWPKALHAEEPRLPNYVAVENLSGTLTFIGSDSMNNVVMRWGEEFEKLYPEVKIQILGKGSSTATGGLLNGQADFGMRVGPLHQNDLATLQARFGHAPTQIVVGCDIMAIFVPVSNPLASLSMQQVDAIFSTTRKSGGVDLSRWSQLLPQDAPQAEKSIQLYGRNSVSVTYGFFKTKALLGGEFKTTVREQPGYAALVRAVAEDIAGCGYAGIGYQTPEVRMVPLKVGDQLIAPTAENIETYPLARKLHLIVNLAPNQQLDPLRREFLKFALSNQGQDSVAQDGYIPLPASITMEQRKRVSIAKETTDSNRESE